MIYLDNNATTRPTPEVVDAMMPWIAEHYGNASSGHAIGTKARKAVEIARGQLADLIGASPAEIIFTSGGTESNNTILHGLFKGAQTPKRLVTTAIEHSAVLAPSRTLEKQGVELKVLGVKANGCPSQEKLEAAVQDGPAVVSIMWANNETGILLPLKEYAETVKAHGGIIHSDAVQALGKTVVNVNDVPVDFLSFSAHKAHGPKGVGALYLRKGTSFHPLLEGGTHEKNLRAGTENVAGIVGFGEACRQIRESQDTMIPSMSAMRDRFEEQLLAAFPAAIIHGRDQDRSTNTTSISFKGKQSESMLIQLSDAGIATSSGSTCTSGLMKVSHVLKAMSIPEPIARGTLRLSISKFTTDEELSQALEILKATI